MLNADEMVSPGFAAEPRPWRATPQAGTATVRIVNPLRLGHRCEADIVETPQQQVRCYHLSR